MVPPRIFVALGPPLPSASRRNSLSRKKEPAKNRCLPPIGRVAGGSRLHWRSSPRGRGLKMSSRYVIAYIDPIVGQPDCGEQPGVCGVGALAHTTTRRDPHARTAHAPPIRARAAEHTSIVHQTRVPFPFPRSPVGGTPSTGLESAAFLRVERSSRCLKEQSKMGRGAMQKCLDRVTRMVCRRSFFSFSMEETRVLRTNNERNFG